MGTNTFRLYGDLAWLWPLWGDPDADYAHYDAHVAKLIAQHAQRPVASLLNIGCGGGKNVYNLKKHYRVTGVDLSPAMLKLAAELNPTCEFVHGDMRSFALGRTFDAVLMDDAISYMVTRHELLSAFRVAFQHLRPGGVMVAVPDCTTETFVQNSTTVTLASNKRKPANIEVVFIENNFDPDPADEHYDATMIYLIRENGVLRVETDTHKLGIFSLDIWRQSLREFGFIATEVPYVLGERQYVTFACVRPM